MESSLAKIILIAYNFYLLSSFNARNNINSHGHILLRSFFKGPFMKTSKLAVMFIGVTTRQCNDFIHTTMNLFLIDELALQLKPLFQGNDSLIPYLND